MFNFVPLPTFPEPLPYQHSASPKVIRVLPICGEKVKEYTVEEFKALTTIKYLSHLEFKNKKVYEEVRSLCKKALLSGTISKRAEWLGVAYRREINEGFVNDVYIRWVDSRMGFGLHANKQMDKGEFIGEYVGLVRPCTYLFANVNEYCFRYPLYRLGFWIYTIDAQDYCNETSFINHSSTPNCDAVVSFNNDLLHVCIRTNQVVERDAQLTYDYGNKIWEMPL